MDFLYIFLTASISWKKIKSKISDSCDLWLLSYSLEAISGLTSHALIGCLCVSMLLESLVEIKN